MRPLYASRVASRVASCIAFCVLILAMAAIRPASAQISIDNSDLFGLVGKSLTSVVDTSGSVEIDLGGAGANQTWDFSSMVVVGEVLTNTTLAPGDTPFADAFPDADLATRITSSFEEDVVMFQYVEVNGDAYRGLGFVILTPTDTTFSMPDDDDLFSDVQIPITYGASWTNVARDTTDLDPVLFVDVDSSTTVVDGWGTLVLPHDAMDALRLRTTTVLISEFYASGSLVSRDTLQLVRYQWFTREALVTVIAQSEGEDPDFTVAGYFQMLTDVSVGTDEVVDPRAARETLVEAAWPNPFTESVTIALSTRALGAALGAAGGAAGDPDAMITATVHDLLGRRIRVLNPPAPGSTATLVWDGRTDGGISAPTGVYYIRVAYGGRSDAKQVTKL